jgi:hypothetical protein
MILNVKAGLAIAALGGAVLAGTAIATSHPLEHRIELIVVPVPSLSDLNADGHVDGSDLAILLAMWAPVDGHGCNGVGSGRPPAQADVDSASSPCQLADLNLDGLVDGQDLAILLGDWTG